MSLKIPGNVPEDSSSFKFRFLLENNACLTMKNKTKQNKTKTEELLSNTFEENIFYTATYN